MGDTQRSSISERIAKTVAAGLGGAFRHIFFWLCIVVPISLAVALLDWCGALAWIAHLMSPLMGLVGLPGEASLVFLSSIFLNTYCAIAVALSMPLDMKSATILAIMCLTAHNLVVETAVMKKTGSSGVKMVIVRLAAAFAAAFAFNFLLPSTFSLSPFSSIHSYTGLDLIGLLSPWGFAICKLAIKIIITVIGVMIVQRLLEEFKVMDLLARGSMPLMKLFGLPRDSSFVWMATNVVGYAYGAGIIEEQLKAGKIKPRDADLFNHHAGLCHSLLEDSILFLAVGFPLFWITVPRLLLAFTVVWLERARRRFFRRSFRVGTV
jgi:hypothetical protein